MMLVRLRPTIIAVVVASLLAFGMASILHQGNHDKQVPSEYRKRARLQEEHDTSLAPMKTFIHNSAVVSPVDFLLDFAIVGHAKTASTFLMNWLGHQPEIRMHPYEVHNLTQHNPVDMVKTLYSLHDTPDHDKYKYGYKAPRDIANTETIDLLSTYWPGTNLIVGVRHPVLWFQSFYNYRLHNFDVLPPPNTLIGECIVDLDDEKEIAALIKQHEGIHDRGVCTSLANFHVHLSYLGKTNVDDPVEDELLGLNRRVRLARTAPLANKVFLYVDEQLKDQDHFPRLQDDLQQFLGLARDLETPHYVEHKGSTYYSPTPHAFDICQNEYVDLRLHLMEIGKRASEWIITFFLPHPDVTVSCPECFETFLSTWSTDPCLNSS